MANYKLSELWNEGESFLFVSTVNRAHEIDDYSWDIIVLVPLIALFDSGA